MTAPEINLARRLATKYHLTPPFRVDTLAKHYARVEVLELPDDLDFDGATFDLKALGRLPTIIVNKGRPAPRRRFTIAHELGHVLIPWHVGSILDEVVPSTGRSDTPYWMLESEANRFASELLMPSSWTAEIFNKLRTPPAALEDIVAIAGVSRTAAAIALINSMPKGYVYAILDMNSRVTYSGRSPDTIANEPRQGTIVDRRRIYPMSDEQCDLKRGEDLFIWWHLPDEITLPDAIDAREWRLILNDIVSDLRIPVSNRAGFKQSVNGIFAYANGRAETRTAEAIYSAAVQRFHSNAQANIRFRRFVNHEHFPLFLRKRAEDLLAKK